MNVEKGLGLVKEGGGVTRSGKTYHMCNHGWDFGVFQVDTMNTEIVACAQAEKPSPMQIDCGLGCVVVLPSMDGD